MTVGQNNAPTAKVSFRYNSGTSQGWLNAALMSDGTFKDWNGAIITQDMPQYKVMQQNMKAYQKQQAKQIAQTKRDSQAAQVGGDANQGYTQARMNAQAWQEQQARAAGKPVVGKGNKGQYADGGYVQSLATGGMLMDAQGRPLPPNEADNSMSTNGVRNNIASALGSFGGNMANAAGMNLTAQDPGAPATEGLAQMKDKFGAEMLGYGAQEVGRGSRNINAEASERAATEGAAENAQAVSQLKGASGSAAALKRSVKTPDVGKVKEENAELRKTGRETLQKGQAELQDAQILRLNNDRDNAAARDVSKFGNLAAGIAAGNPGTGKATAGGPPPLPDSGPPALPNGNPPALPSGAAPRKTATQVTEKAQESTGVTPEVEANADKNATELAATNPPQYEEYSQRVNLALEDFKGTPAEKEAMTKIGIDALNAEKNGDTTAWEKQFKAAADPHVDTPINPNSGMRYGESTDNSVQKREVPAAAPAAQTTPAAQTGGSATAQAGAGATTATSSSGAVTPYSGGFTGAGQKYEPAGVVHKGEYVIPQEGVNQKTKKPDINYVKKLVSDRRLKRIQSRIKKVVRSF
jgi:hypothetical protein